MKILIALALFLVLSSPLLADTVTFYKWVDKNGNVTYQQFPPPVASDQIEEKTIDPDQNVIKMSLPPPAIAKAPITTTPVPQIRYVVQPIVIYRPYPLHLLHLVLKHALVVEHAHHQAHVKRARFRHNKHKRKMAHRTSHRKTRHTPVHRLRLHHAGHS